MNRLAIPMLLLVVLATACSPPSADDLVRQVLEQRRNYDVKLTSWILRPDGSAYLDIQVINNNESALGTLTVLVEQLDVDNNTLASSRVGVDVSALSAGLGQGLGVSVANAIPEVEGIRVSVEANPPRESWGEFKELDGVRPRI